MTRSSIGRLVIVVAALAAAGALTGAMCGVLALTPLIISQWLRSTPEIHFTRGVLLVLWGARAGALIGAIVGPTFAVGLLRRVPLWRVIAWTSLGTVVGSLAGWAAAGTALVPSGPAVGVGSVLGMVAGGVVLRLRVHRSAQTANAEAAS